MIHLIIAIISVLWKPVSAKGWGKNKQTGNPMIRVQLLSFSFSLLLAILSLYLTIMSFSLNSEFSTK